jgi:hypothetical protein
MALPVAAALLLLGGLALLLGLGVGWPAWWLAPASVAPVGSTPGGVRGVATATAVRTTTLPTVLVPPDPAAAGRAWFAPIGPGGNAGDGPGVWERLGPQDAWTWQPLPAAVVDERVYAGAGAAPAPPWPADVTYFRAERVCDGQGMPLGYWVWNAAFFVRLPWGSHQWSPRWQWTPQGEPMLLVPDVFPVDFGTDGPIV